MPRRLQWRRTAVAGAKRRTGRPATAPGRRRSAPRLVSLRNAGGHPEGHRAWMEAEYGSGVRGMAVEIRVPPLGESLVDAVVGTWLKQEGDSVNRGESLVELETDKVNLDVTAEEDGVLARIERREGEVVTVGEVLGLVSGSNGATAPAPETATATTAAAPAPTPTPAAETPLAATPPPVAPAPPVLGTSAAAEDDADGAGGGRAAPAVRRLAEEHHHIDLNTVTGTGPGGRVTREDVLIVA